MTVPPAHAAEVAAALHATNEPVVVYPPSFVDRLADRLEASGRPWWLPYAIVAVVLLAVEVAILWTEQRGVPSVSAFAVYFAVAAPYALALVHLLDRRAEEAFGRFLDAVPDARRAAALRLGFELTTMRLGMPAIAALVGVALGVIGLGAGGSLDDQLRMAGLGTGSASMAFNLAVYVANWAATGILVYHTVHQLRRIGAIVELGEVDPLAPRPLFAFSDLAAVTVVGLTILMYGPVLLLPAVDDPTWLVVRLAVAILLAAVFLLPLLGVRRLLAAERDRLLTAHERRWRVAVQGLHGALEAGDLEAAEQADRLVEVTEHEGKVLRAAPTWPWSPEVGRTVTVALLIPLVVGLLGSIIRAIAGL